MKWRNFPRYWSFVRGIHRSSVNSSHKGQWRGALVFSLICVWINGWVNNREAGDLIRHRGHYDVIVMTLLDFKIYIPHLAPIGFSQATGYSYITIMNPMASQLTSVPIVFSTVCSGVDQRKHQSSTSLAFVRGIHRWPVNSPHKGPVTWKMFPFDDVIMYIYHALHQIKLWPPLTSCKPRPQ